MVHGQCGPQGCAIGIRGPYGGGFEVQTGPGFQVHAGTCRPAYARTHPPAHRRDIAGSASKNPIALVDNIHRTAQGSTIHNPATGWICARNETWTYVATAAHIISTAVGELRVDVDGSNYAAELAGVDQAWDILVLAIANAGRQPLTIATRPPPIGSAVRIIGRTSGSAAGQVARYVAPGDGTRRFEMIDVSGAIARPGDSGGPIINAVGQVVALISGSDANYTTATATPRLTNILQTIITQHWKSKRAPRPPKPVAEPPPPPPAPITQPPPPPHNVKAEPPTPPPIFQPHAAAYFQIVPR